MFWRGGKEPEGVPLEGAQVRLRLLSGADAARISELVSDPDVVKQTLSLNAPYSVEAAEDWIAHELNRQMRNHLVLVVELTGSGELIGTVSLHVRRTLRGRYGLLGYWIGKPYWGRGCGNEAVALFLPFVIQAFKLTRIDARVFENNEASQRVLERNGFRRVRKKRLFVPDRGGRRLIYTYRLRTDRS